MPDTSEDLCRQLLRQAMNDGVIREELCSMDRTIGVEDLSSGELVGMANMMASIMSDQVEQTYAEVRNKIKALYDTGPGRGTPAWQQAWGSGVLDALDAIDGKK